MAAEAGGNFGGIVLSTFKADGMGKAYLGSFCLDDGDITGRTENGQTASKHTKNRVHSRKMISHFYPGKLLSSNEDR